MELILLDSSFREFDIIDTFRSLIWTDRYYEAGDFEVVLSPNSNIISRLENASYVRLKESEHLMFPEVINIVNNPEKGNELVLKGRSIESMLDRRIIWDISEVLNSNLQTYIHDLIDDAIINPVNTYRDISNFIFDTSSDTAITSLLIDAQFYGEFLYDAIFAICKSKSIGFKITESSGNFHFGLYAGVDRSTDQLDREAVTFFTSLDNLINAEYIKSTIPLKTVALIAGEKGVANYRITTVVYDSGGSSVSGLNRRELFVDASNMSQNSSSGQLTREEYINLLQGRGYEELAKNIVSEYFEGEIDPIEYVYGVDFFMGDVLQIEDNNGHSSKSRVVELIHFQDPSTIQIYPTFEAVL